MNTTSRRLIGTSTLAGLMVVAPLLMMTEQLLSPLTDGTTSQDLVAIQVTEGRYVASVLIGTLGTLLMIPALVGLCSHLVARAPWSSRIAAALAASGLACFMGVRLGQAVELQGLRDGLPQQQVADLLDHLESNPIGTPIVIVFLAGTVLGMFVLAVAAWCGGLPKPVAVLLVAFPLIDLGASSNLVSAAAHLVLTVALGWAGISLVRAERSTVPEPEAALAPA